MSEAAATTTGVGHGKVILLGEHAVVYGHPAVAAGLGATVRAHASPGTGVLSVPAWQLEVVAGDDSPPGQALARLLDSLGVGRATLDFWVETDVPARAGLGSSAAMAVAVARAVARRTGASEDAVMAAVTAAEMVFHGSPSGIDAAAASRGRLGRFDKQHGWEDLPLAKPFELCIGLSGKARATGVLVAQVRELCASTPVATRVVDALGEIALAGMEALRGGDLAALARLFNLAHGLLAGLGVSTPELDDMVHTARDAGAAGAKLTGGGGGGAVIALAADRAEEVLRRWRTKGYYGFVTTIGHA